MKKRIVCILLLLLCGTLAAALCSCDAVNDVVGKVTSPYSSTRTTDDGYQYYLNEDVVCIRGYTGSETVLRIPETIESRPVVRIEENAFAGQKQIRKVIVPENVWFIASRAFYGCSALEEIELPKSLLVLGDHDKNYIPSACGGTYEDSKQYWDSVRARAESERTPQERKNTYPSAVFDGCTSLKTVRISEENPIYQMDGNCIIDRRDGTLLLALRGTSSLKEGIERIDAGAFIKDENTEFLQIPEGVREIGNGTFSGFSGLKEIVLPESLEIIGEAAFEGCTSLKEVLLPAGVREIGAAAFRGCTSLQTIRLPSVTPKNNWNQFSGGIFEDCTALTSVQIPDGWETLPARMFCGCTGIREISIGAGLKTILASFAYVGGVEQITVSPENHIFQTDGKSLIFANSEIVLGAPDGSIPDGFRGHIIGEYAFSGYTLPEEISIPASITEIQTGAFEKTCGVKRIIFENHKEYPYTMGKFYIDSSAFEGSADLEQVEFPVTIRELKIDSLGFARCPSLKSFSLPNATTTLGSAVLLDCTALEELRLCSNLTAIPGSMAYGCTSLESVFFPRNGYYLTIPRNAFRNCAIRTLNLPAEIMAVEAGAFDGCPLESITVDANNRYLSVKDNCLIEKASGTLLLAARGARIPDDGSVKIIGEKAFSGCDWLTEIVIPDSVEEIGDFAFSKCSGVERISISPRTQKISGSSFGQVKFSRLDFRGSFDEWKDYSQIVRNAYYYSSTKVYCEEGEIANPFSPAKYMFLVKE